MKSNDLYLLLSRLRHKGRHHFNLIALKSKHKITSPYYKLTYSNNYIELLKIIITGNSFHKGKKGKKNYCQKQINTLSRIVAITLPIESGD